MPDHHQPTLSTRSAMPWGIIEGTASSVLAHLLIRTSELLRKALPATTLWGYRRELAARIAEMPFIYRELELELLTDFVQPELRVLDPGDLSIKPPADWSDLTPAYWMKQRRHCLLLGKAGMGKTTFQRRSILGLLQSGAPDAYFFENEKLVPFYVPLKAVDNLRPFPILRYLVESTPLLAGSRGLRRLVRLGRQRRVFLLLDGYDEIPFPTPTNHVRQEIELLLGVGAVPSVQQDEQDFGTIARELATSRIWLSSRREFFDVHPIGDVGAGAPSGQLRWANVGAIWFNGLGENRAALVKRIFDRYRAAAFFRERLNVELFLHQVDTAIDGELTELSQNPLFLTVMAYNYINKVREAGTPDIPWRKTADDLVTECIRLLLRDLDGEKARKLTAAERLALRGRRNDFVEEKLAFLEQFAFRLYLTNETVFDRGRLFQAAREFFAASRFPTRGAILRYLDDTTTPLALPNQLIFSGVFTIVDGRGASAILDFPHRRFREVLAVSYLGGNAAQLVANLRNQQLSELLLVAVQNAELRDPILRRLLLLTRENPDDQYYGRTLASAVAELGAAGPWLSHLLLDFFESAIRDDARFILPARILGHVAPDPDWQGMLHQELFAAVESAKANGTALVCELLEHFRPALAKRSARDALERVNEITAALPPLLKRWLRMPSAERGDVPPMLQRLRALPAPREARDRFLLRALAHYTTLGDAKHLAEVVADADTQRTFLFWLHEENSSLYRFFTDPNAPNHHVRTYSALTHEEIHQLRAAERGPLVHHFFVR